MWLIALTALALLSPVRVPLALAAGHGEPQDELRPDAAKAHVKFQCEATVVSDSFSSEATVTVIVKSGSNTIKAYRGNKMTVQVDPKAKLITGPSIPPCP